MSERALDLVVVGHPAGGRIVHGRIDVAELDLVAPAAPASTLVGAGVDEQAMEPCVESFGVAQGREVAPGADERFLHGVLGGVRVVEDEAGRPVEPVHAGSRERIERSVIAALRLDHQRAQLCDVVPCMYPKAEGRVRSVQSGRQGRGTLSSGPRHLPSAASWSTFRATPPGRDASDPARP